MNHVKSAAFIFAMTLIGASSTLAGVRDVVQTSVKLLIQPDNPACLSQPTTCNYRVTYTSLASGLIPALNSYVGYDVAIANTGKNTVNKVIFTGTLSVTASNESAPLFRVDGANCQSSQSNNKTSISCDFGTLSSGQSVPRFQVFFRSPIRDQGFTGTDTVSFSGITYYSETTNGGAPSPKNSQSYWGPLYQDASNPPTARLGTPNPTNISTTLPASTQNQTIFTGDGSCGTSSGYPFVTNLVVPPSPTLTSMITLSDAVSTDSSSFCSNSANFNTCYSSQISIPGGSFTSAPWLSIVLRISSSNGNIKTNDIARINLQYTDGIAPPVPITSCLVTETPNGDGVPCISTAKTYFSGGGGGGGGLAPQCFEWTLLNTKNGSYRVF